MNWQVASGSVGTDVNKSLSLRKAFLRLKEGFFQKLEKPSCFWDSDKALTRSGLICVLLTESMRQKKVVLEM